TTFTKPNKSTSKDLVTSQQLNNSVATRIRARKLSSGSPLPSLSLSPSKKSTVERKEWKAVRKQAVKDIETAIENESNNSKGDDEHIIMQPTITITANGVEECIIMECIIAITTEQ
ncbi:hypothetical protein E2562_003108, partial [Oryza meyeriana var. granulata]